MKQILFLTYLSRSGSTLLARMLDEYVDIGVTPEARIPDGITHGDTTVSDNSDQGSYPNELYNDEKFRAWNVSRGNIRLKLEQFSLPVRFQDILLSILSEYFLNGNVSTYVIKQGLYIHHLDTIDRYAQDANSSLL